MCYDSGADDEKAVPRNLNDISIRSASIAYVSIAAGYCMGIALVHAGTANEGANQVICSMLRMLLRLRAGRLIKVQKQARAMGSFSFTAFPFFSSAFVKSCAEKTCKSLVEMYVSCLSLSAGVVMAGTGDVSVLRLVRELRMKNEDAIFGSQIAAAMTAGTLLVSVQIKSLT